MPYYGLGPAFDSPLLNSALSQSNPDQVDRKALDHREAASRVSQCESVYSLSKIDLDPPPVDATYSTKVFLGGVPWCMSDEEMVEEFSRYGACTVQRPGKDVKLSRQCQGLERAGYLYLIFEESDNVNKLIQACNFDFSEKGHKYFYNLVSKKSKKEKRVQVIPWNIADSLYTAPHHVKLDQHRTVFLGALHGMMNAHTVANALSIVFGSVEYVSLDMDKFRYPMGSGRAMFTFQHSYEKAINAQFFKIKSDQFEKTVSQLVVSVFPNLSSSFPGSS